MQIYIDGELATTLTEPDKSGLWSWEWDARKVPVTERSSYDYTGLSLHTIYAKAQNADGDISGTEVISVIVRDYSFKGNTYINWRYNFQISTEGTDWGMLTGGELPGQWYYGVIRGMVSVTPGPDYYSSESYVLLFVFARPYLGSLSAYEEEMNSQLEFAYVGEPTIYPNRNFSFTSGEDTRIHGIPAREWSFDVSEQYDVLRTVAEGKVDYLVKDGVAYAIYSVVGGWSYSGYKYSDYEADLDQILSNFKFL